MSNREHTGSLTTFKEIGMPHQPFHLYHIWHTSDPSAKNNLWPYTEDNFKSYCFRICWSLLFSSCTFSQINVVHLLLLLLPLLLLRFCWFIVLQTIFSASALHFIVFFCKCVGALSPYSPLFLSFSPSFHSASWPAKDCTSHLHKQSWTLAAAECKWGICRAS